MGDCHFVGKATTAVAAGVVHIVDAGSIGTWAKDVVKQMQMAGILMGKSGKHFDPSATTTRAEVSAMLRRYVELKIPQ